MLVITAPFGEGWLIVLWACYFLPGPDHKRTQSYLISTDCTTPTLLPTGRWPTKKSEQSLLC